MGARPLPCCTVLTALLLAAVGCDRGVKSSPRRTVTPAHSAAVPASPPQRAVESAEVSPLTAREFSSLVQELSEPDHRFFSDNLVSNETSILEPARELAGRASGGAYIGVGPEQNFTLIALTRPSLAFIVDIRRGNLLLHLLYKAIFDEAATRSQFLALLLGRPWTANADPGVAATIDAVIAHAERAAPSEAEFQSSHARLIAHIQNDYLIPLDADDVQRLATFHRAFYERQLTLTFELTPQARKKSGRKYPPLDALLRVRDERDRVGSFLASEAAFRTVQTLERENRLIPVVGDFAGRHAMPGVARVLAERKLVLSVFYTSNVEQYLFDDQVWPQWIANLRALPQSSQSAIVRVYLDQGRPHPLQHGGERSTTLLARLEPFLARDGQRPFRTFWEVVTWTE